MEWQVPKQQWKYTVTIVMYLEEFGASKALLTCNRWHKAIPQTQPKCLLYALQEPLKGAEKTTKTPKPGSNGSGKNSEIVQRLS